MIVPGRLSAHHLILFLGIFYEYLFAFACKLHLCDVRFMTSPVDLFVERLCPISVICHLSCFATVPMRIPEVPPTLSSFRAVVTPLHVTYCVSIRKISRYFSLPDYNLKTITQCLIPLAMDLFYNTHSHIPNYSGRSHISIPIIQVSCYQRVVWNPVITTIVCHSIGTTGTLITTQL